MITLFIVLKEQLTVSVDDLASLHYLIFASHSSSIIHRFKGPHSKKFLTVLVEYFNARRLLY